MKLTRRTFFFGGAVAAVAVPVAALLPAPRDIAPGHGGYVEIWPGKMTWVDNQTNETMSRESWVEAFPN